MNFLKISQWTRAGNELAYDLLPKIMSTKICKSPTKMVKPIQNPLEIVEVQFYPMIEV
jgi:hypothetical protein